MATALPLLAQASSSRTYYEVMRLRQLDEWWHWMLLLLVCGVVVTAVTTLYFLDSRQLARGKKWLLLLLRMLAFAGLLIFFLDLQKRTEQKVVRNSRFALLIDASQSMGIADQTDGEAKQPRIGSVASVLADGGLISELRQQHDVAIYRFDETNQPTEVASFSQHGEEKPTNSSAETGAVEAGLGEVRAFWKMAAGMFLIAAVALIAHFVLGSFVRTPEGESWALLASVLALIVGVVLVAVSNLRQPRYGPRVAFGWVDLPTEAEPLARASDVDTTGLLERQSSSFDWAALLEPSGGSTRLGDAITWLIRQERGSPLAGIAIVTDGNSNRGAEPLQVAQLARDAGFALYPIGMGSEIPPRNVRVVDLDAPARVYPGDEFKLTGYVQAYGMTGRTVELELRSRPDSNTDGAEELVEAEAAVEISADGDVQPVSFQVAPAEVGKRVYSLRIADEDVDDDQSDNQVASKVQIVDRQTRVLLVAGGPTREYRFLRNMLHRDKDVTVDVLLQTAVEGVSQEANEILFDLPREPAELFDYDCIAAFDPDWTQFDQVQLDLLDTWVAEKAGGLVCIAGPVHTAAWAENRRAPAQIEVVKQLYPVTFHSLTASRIQLGRFGSPSAWPLEITRDGRNAPFLELADEAYDAREVWDQFAGVYGYYPVRDVKPAAVVYARYGDPQAAIDGEQPPLIVGQFYGAGKVVFLGTGEFWRMRRLDEAYFERFYTKLIRFVSEGRLLRDSNRGLLLVDKERALRGDAITVRASAVDFQFQPLQDPTLKVTLHLPDETTQELDLQRLDAQREGMYSGRFIAVQPGDYALELALPGDGEPVLLEREVRVRLPNLEIEQPQRDDGLMRQLATLTGGKYFIGLPGAIDPPSGLAASLTSMRRETFLPGTPDRDFQRRLMTWLLALICGALCLEWLIRRLSKLA